MFALGNICVERFANVSIPSGTIFRAWFLTNKSKEHLLTRAYSSNALLNEFSPSGFVQREALFCYEAF